MQLALLGLIAAFISSAGTATTFTTTSGKPVSAACPAFPDIGSKYGSDGGSLFKHAFNATSYPIEALPQCEPCKGQESIKRYKGGLASKLPGINAHLLQVMTSNEAPGYSSGNKVVRVLYTQKDSAPVLVKIREYTLQNDGGYYRRSRFFQFSCPGAFSEIVTAETKANSKASYGVKLVRAFTNSSASGKEYRFDPGTYFSQKPALAWQMDVSGSKPWLASINEPKSARVYHTAADATVVRMQSKGLSEIGPLSVEYFFSTYAVGWKAGQTSLQLQEDLMESVVTVDTTKIQPRLQADSILQVVYEVYTGQAKLQWVDKDKVLSVTPVDATTKLPIPALQEFYQFAPFALCISEVDGSEQTSRLDFARLEAKIPKEKQWTGFVSITGDLLGTEKCKQVVWDPTNGELVPQSAPTSTPSVSGSLSSTVGPTVASSVSSALAASLAPRFVLLLSALWLSALKP